MAAKDNPKVALAALVHSAALLRCSIVRPGGRRLAALWLSRAEWQLVLLSVVMVCFMGSWELHSSDESCSGHDWAKLTAGTSWLEYPGCVRKSTSTQSKRIADLRTCCVLPASDQRMQQNHLDFMAWQAGQAAQGGSSSNTGLSIDRNLKYWVNDAGYGYVEFDVLASVAMEEDSRPGGEVDGRWRTVSHTYTKRVSVLASTPHPEACGVIAAAQLMCPSFPALQTEATYRIGLGLHVLIAYLSAGYRGEASNPSACPFCWLFSRLLHALFFALGLQF